MKIAYHLPSLNTVYAHRTIYYGYKNAFEDMGHEFFTYTAGMNLEEFLQSHKPDIFISSSHFFWRKQLDYTLLKKYRDKGMVLVTKIDFWNSPLEKFRINEAPEMKKDVEVKRLIRDGLLGDVYMHVVEQGDARMSGFETIWPKGYATLPLAADKKILIRNYQDKFDSDIAFIGTNLPQKREHFKQWLLPLGKKYNLKLYGQDWTLADKTSNNIQKVGQFFNIPVMKSIRKPTMGIGDEAAIYSSSKILVNIHEEYQRKFGGDCNERTFKIPACGGLEITDDVACISKYYKDGEHLVIAKNKNDWFDKIDYYIQNPDKAHKIAKNGMKHTLSHHTYHNRAEDLLKMTGL